MINRIVHTVISPGKSGIYTISMVELVAMIDMVCETFVVISVNQFFRMIG
jgi:hypothetical protein